MTAAGNPPEGEGELGRLIERAYAARTTFDAAASHLWAIERESQRLRRHRRRHRLASLAASVVVLVAGVGTVAGSATALPGEPLYSLKEGLERTELAVAFTDAASARAHLRHARQRLAELEALADRAPEEVPALAERFFAALEHAADAGGDNVTTEVAALRSSGMLLIDRVAADLDPALADAVSPRAGAGASEPRDPVRDSSGSHQARAEGRAADDGGAPAGSAGGGDPPSQDSPDTMSPPPPETSVVSAEPETGEAESGPPEEDEADDGSEAAPPEDPVDETETVEVPDDPDALDVSEETATAETSNEADEDDGNEAGYTGPGGTDR